MCRLEEQSRNEKYYIKEMYQKSNTDLKIEGRAISFLGSGGGSIYGYSNEYSQFTILYYDNETLIDDEVGLHRVLYLNESDLKISTIGVNETPYMKYGMVKVHDYISRLVVKVSDPVLYLPDGWSIFKTENSIINEGV